MAELLTGRQSMEIVKSGTTYRRPGLARTEHLIALARTVRRLAIRLSPYLSRLANAQGKAIGSRQG